MRKSLVFTLIAVLSALLVFTSCSNGTTDVQYITDPIGGIADAKPAGTEAELQQLLTDTTDDKPIVFSVSQNFTLDSVTWIPPGKTVYIKPVDHSTGGTLTPKAGEGLSVAGTLIVTGNAELKALSNNQVHLVNGGALKIENLGALSTATRADVDNYPDNLASMLSRVSYAGGSTLSITNEILKIDDIQQLLGLITPAEAKAAAAPAGASKLVLGLPQPFMPSQLAAIPGLSGERYLQVTANVQETAETLIIPAGIAITVPADKPLPVIALTVNGQFEVPAGALAVLTSLTVSGSLAAPGNTLPALKDLTVSGTLDAPNATGDTTAGITINVAAGGTVTVGTVKPAEGSLVANGGKFNGDTGTTGIPTEKGALINGEESTGGSIVILAAIPQSLAEGTSQLKPGVYTLAAALTIPETATLSLPTGTTLTIGTSGAVTVNGTLAIAQGSKVTVGAAGTITKGAAGTIKNEGTLAFEADSADTLNGTTTPAALGAIGKVKALGNDGSGAFVQLTQAFYSATGEATAALVVDPGETDNTSPYIIKGLGKDSTQVITAGILLANNNVTLEDVKINVTNPTKAASIGSGSPRYTAAVSIGRAYDNVETLTFLTGVKLASKNVIVQNSDITIDFTADTVNPTYTHDAGIYICADRSVAPPENITITGNTVRSKGRGTSAAQGLAVGSYGPSISITNNSLKSETGGAETINAPAAGLFMSIMPNRVNATDTPNITGNTLDGKNIDFYVNIYPTGDYKGIPALFDAKFGTAASKWAVTNVSNSFYGKLYATLIGQAKPTGYAGSFFMGFPYTDPEQWGYRFAYEAWEKNAGRVVAVDYWGPTIQSGASIYDAQGKRIDHSGAEATYGTTGGYRGRIVLATGGIEAFHWNPTTAEDTDTYSTVPQQE